MRLARTYIFDAFVNLFGQGILILVGLFAWTSIPGTLIWALAASGFSVFLSIMERGAESRHGACFIHYILAVLLPAVAAAIIVSAVCGVFEYSRWSAGYSPLTMIISPFYPVFIAAGSIWITLVFLAVNRLTRKEK